MRAPRPALFLLPPLLVSGCADVPSRELVPPTWTEDVAPLVAAHCLPCHGPGGAGEPRLDSYERARDAAGWMAWAVEERVMPPYGAEDTGECGPPEGWPEAPSLADADIATFAAWADAGAPAGPLGATPLSEDETPLVAEPFDRFVPGVPVDVPATGDDAFRCVLLDPGFEEDVWLTGLQVLPGAAEVVHHVLVLGAHPDDAEALDEANAAGTLDCSSMDPTGSGARTLALWAPGAHPLELPPGAGLWMPGGSRLLLQIHYHPSGQEVTDATGVGLRWVEESPEKVARIQLLGNLSAPYLQPGPGDPPGGPVFLIPPGESAHPEEMLLPGVAGSGEVELFGLAPHMHYVGTEMEVALQRPGGDEQCLVRVPRWDFEWQRWYSYAQTDLPALDPEDALVLRCRYDNTLNNERLREALIDEGLTEPRFVGLGPTSLDEMCAVLVGVARDAPP